MHLAASRPEEVIRLGLLIDAYLARAAAPEDVDPEAPPEELMDTLKGLGYIE